MNLRPLYNQLREKNKGLTMNLRPLYNQLREKNKGLTIKPVLDINPWQQVYKEVRVKTWTQIFLTVASPVLAAIK
jgi:hypothetical protein